MGLSSKKQKTTSTSQTSGTSTSTPNVPDWLLNPAQNLAGGITSLQQQGASAYTPGESALQQQAATGASNLTTSPLISQAGQQVSGINYTPSTVTPQTVQSQSLLDGLQNYMSPYTNDVVNTTLADYDENSGKVRAAQAAQAAGTGAFRGSRYGIQEGETEGQLARGREAADAQLRDQAFTTGAGLSNQDADRRQSASTVNASNGLTAQQANQNAGLTATGQKLTGAGLLSGIGQTQGSEDRANVATQGALGSQQTALENQIKQYPLQYQTTLEGLLAGLDPAMYSGQTTNSSGTSSGTSTTVQNQSIGSLLASLMQSFAQGAGQGAAGGA